MVIQQHNNTTYCVWVSDRKAQLQSVMTHFKLLNNQNQPFKYVQVNMNDNFTPKGGISSLSAISILAKDKAIFVMDNSFTFHLQRTDIKPLANALNKFGGSHNLVIGDTMIKGPFHVTDATHLSSGGGKIAIGQFIDNTIETKVDEFIHRMNTDNGRMLSPLAKKFSDIAHLMGGNRGRLTGYANLNVFLRMLNKPMLNTSSLVKDMANSPYLLHLPLGQMQAKVVVTGIEGSTLVITLISSAKLFSGNHQLPQKFPYLILTAKPFRLQDQQFPFFAMPFKQHRLFVTAIILDTDDPLKSLSGGLNLLK